METLVISEPDADRYSRLKLIEWWDQSRLAQARIMVIGCGALGNEVLKNLALLGIGHVLLVDFDLIEISNLSRSVLFQANDQGLPKAEVAANRVKEINSDVKVKALHQDILWQVGLGLYRRMDVVLGCLDNREARLAVNQACWRMGVPWVDGALQELMGLVRVFVPPDSACYECTLANSDYEELNQRYSCSLLRQDVPEAVIPTTPTSASVIGALQVQEALKLLHHLDPPAMQAGCGFFFNGLINTFELIRYKRADNCLSHECFNDIIELPIGVHSITLKDLLEIAREHLGGKATVDLRREIVTEFDCLGCGQSHPVFKPLSALSEQDSYCPYCGETCSPTMTHLITGDEPFLDLKPGDLGIPPLDIVIARNQEQYLFLEFSADAVDLLKFI
jgi:molybdopterin/thiamine biosynthesis adenylyltransferase